MNSTSHQPRIAFRLRGPVTGSPAYRFTVDAPYSAGQTITLAEAQALNQLRAENVQNNMRTVFQQELAACLPGELLSQEALSRVQEQVDRYAQNYKFLEKHSPKAQKPKLGAIEREAQNIAQEEAEAQARARGLDLEEEALQELAQSLAELPWVQEEARKRVAARAQIAQSSLEDLL